MSADDVVAFHQPGGQGAIREKQGDAQYPSDG
jgi:hypothetical protein